jgi:hypothetical protein
LKEHELVHVEEHELVHVQDTTRGTAAETSRLRSEPAVRLRHTLRNRSGLQSAILLSEILAPPLALRDNSGF